MLLWRVSEYMLAPPCGVKLMCGGVVQRASEGGFSAAARSNRFNPAPRSTRVDMRPRVKHCRPHPLRRLLGSGGHSLRVAVLSVDQQACELVPATHNTLAGGCGHVEHVYKRCSCVFADGAVDRQFLPSRLLKCKDGS